ncbi:MAG: MMPL family transporter [Myxococcota bacterium]|nr:MMPL family transporter [Myxococcota bacterium]
MAVVSRLEMFLALARIVLARRLLFGVGVLFCFGVLVAGVTGLQVDFSARAFFAGEGQAATQLEEFKSYWGEDDDGLIVVVDGGGETLLARDRLEQLQELGELLGEDPAVAQVLSAVEVPRFKRDFLGATLPVPLLATVPAEDLGQEAWRAWEQELLADPLLVPALLSEDGQYAALIVELGIDVDDIALVRPVVERLQTVAEEFGADRELRLLVGGVPMVRGLVSRMILDEQQRLVPIAFVLVLILLSLLFRSAYGVFVPMLAALLPTLMLFGLMGWVGEPISLLNQAYFTLIPVIAVADAIHMVSRFREEIRKNTPEGQVPSLAVRNAAVTSAMQHVGAACLMTTLTTVVGFLSLEMAQMPVLRSFGLYAAAGIALSYAGVLILIPLLLSVVRPKATGGGSRTGTMSRWLRRCADVSVEQPKLCLLVALVVCLVSMGFGSRVVVNNWLTRTLPVDLPASEANRLVDEELGGIIALRYDLQASPGAFANPEVLEAIDGLEEEARRLEGVRWTSSPASVLALGSRALGGPLEVPRSRSVAEHIYQRLESSTIGHQAVSENKDRAQLAIYCEDVGALRFGGLRQAMDANVSEALGRHGITTFASGTPVVAYAGINRIVFDLRDSLSLAFFVVTVLLMLLVRNLRLGLLCVVPNALPLVVGYGMLGLLGWELEPATGVVFTVALGIAVDDTIHLLARYLEELERGLDQRAALTEAIVNSGRAVLVTTIVLVTGFFVNLLSTFPTNFNFGGVGGVVILVALLCDLFVLPPMILLFHRPTAFKEKVSAHS